MNHDNILQAPMWQNWNRALNPPLVPHHGGVSKRRIRVVHCVLLALLISAPIMTDDILHTALCESLIIVNSWLLTKCSYGRNDKNTLIPNHLLIQSRTKQSDIKLNQTVGDLVILMDKNALRGSWHLGLVLETSVGRDGFVCSSRLHTSALYLWGWNVCIW